MLSLAAYGIIIQEQTRVTTQDLHELQSGGTKQNL